MNSFLNLFQGIYNNKLNPKAGAVAENDKHMTRIERFLTGSNIVDVNESVVMNFKDLDVKPSFFNVPAPILYWAVWFATEGFFGILELLVKYCPRHILDVHHVYYFFYFLRCVSISLNSKLI